MVSNTAELLERIADPNTAPELLPVHLVSSNNQQERLFCLDVLGYLVNTKLEKQDRELVRRIYWKEENRQEVSEWLEVSQSTIGRRLEKVEEELGEYLEFALVLYRNYFA